MWNDKRIFYKETPQATTHVLDYGLLSKIWSPKLKVGILRQLPLLLPFCSGQTCKTKQQWQQLWLSREVPWNCDDGRRANDRTDQPDKSRNQLSHALQILSLWHSNVQLHHRTFDVRCSVHSVVSRVQTVGWPEYTDELWHNHPTFIGQVPGERSRRGKELYNV